MIKIHQCDGSDCHDDLHVVSMATDMPLLMSHTSTYDGLPMDL